MFGLHLTYKYLSYSAPPADAPIPPPPDGLERHFLQTPSGRIELLYATPPTSTSPSASRPTTPVLFVHGGMGSAWVWTPYLLYLASHGVPCYAVSMRGHGDSWYPSYLRMTFGTFRSDLTDDVLAALEYVEDKHGEKVLLVGHSSGGGLSQGMLSDGKAKVKGLALLGAVPCFGSMGVYRNWARADPWFTLRMILHLYHPNSPLSHPALVRRIFFSPSFPEGGLMDFWSHGSRYEAFFWPFSMIYNFASPNKILRAVTGGEKGGDRVMVMTGTGDVIMTRDIMVRLGEVYRAGMRALVGGKKVDPELEEEEGDGNDGGVGKLSGEGGQDERGDGVRVTWVHGAGHHLQNDVQWEVGAEKLLAFYQQL